MAKFFYNSPACPDFAKDIAVLHEQCSEKQTGWSLHYVKTNDAWYFKLTPSAKGEGFTGKDCFLSTAIADALKHLETVGKS